MRRGCPCWGPTWATHSCGSTPWRSHRSATAGSRGGRSGPQPLRSCATSPPPRTRATSQPSCASAAAGGTAATPAFSSVQEPGLAPPASAAAARGAGLFRRGPLGVEVAHLGAFELGAVAEVRPQAVTRLLGAVRLVCIRSAQSLAIAVRSCGQSKPCTGGRSAAARRSRKLEAAPAEAKHMLPSPQRHRPHRRRSVSKAAQVGQQRPQSLARHRREGSFHSYACRRPALAATMVLLEAGRAWKAHAMTVLFDEGPSSAARRRHATSISQSCKDSA
mmetsp:Transcript_48418/g.136179  ORF Transcript_48418/g.136179 Transcript_48418/m.136179 type:complete len:276 (+) Transcript_48418:271-1098(+)